MRLPVDEARLRQLMAALGRAAREPARVYFTGGVTALLLGWRATTIDVDLKIIPESDLVLRAIPELKDALQINVELASPGDFIPELPGWQERSRFIDSEGPLSFYHYDFYAQALAKIERGHTLDRQDVREMMARGLVDRARLVEVFESVVPALYRYPAIDPAAFRRAVLEAVGSTT